MGLLIMYVLLKAIRSRVMWWLTMSDINQEWEDIDNDSSGHEVSGAKLLTTGGEL